MKLYIDNTVKEAVALVAGYVPMETGENMIALKDLAIGEHAIKAVVEAAEDVNAGRVYSWDEFKPRLARLRAKAKRIAGK